MAQNQTLLMTFDLSQAIEGPSLWPSGVRLIPFQPAKHSRPARRLMNLAYQDGGGDCKDWQDWWPSLRSDPEYAEDLCFVVIDTRSDELIGFAQCWVTGFIKDLVIHPELQRQGIGRALLLHVFRALAERGRKRCALKARTDNPSQAVAFYLASGMEISA